MQEKYYIWQNHIMHIELINLISPVGKKFRRNTPHPCSSNAPTQFQRHLEVTERRMMRSRKNKCLTPASAMLQPMQRCRKITEILDLPLDIRLVIACNHSQTEHSIATIKRLWLSCKCECISEKHPISNGPSLVFAHPKIRTLRQRFLHRYENCGPYI